MAKNRAFINMMKNNKKSIDHVTAQIYAAMIIAMHRAEFEDDDIRYIIASTNEIWREATAEKIDLAYKCEEETGMVVKTELEVERMMKLEKGDKNGKID